MKKPAPPPALPGEVLLLGEQGFLTPAKRQTLLGFTFTVPGWARSLAIWLDYSPRCSRRAVHNAALVGAAVARQRDQALDDGVLLEAGAWSPPEERPGLARLIRALPNLLNLSLIDSRGRARGRWDRNQAGQPRDEALILAERWAGPGLVAGPVPGGEWTATLEVHEVVSERVEYRLRIHALPLAPPEGGFARPPRRGRRPRPEPEYPRPSPEGWLRGELHSHTTASDGLYEPERLAERALDLGLEFLAVTDHNTTSALPGLAGAPLPILPGCEVTTFYGHFPVYGVRDAPPWYEGGRVLGPREIQDRLDAGAPGGRGGGAGARQGRGPLFSLGHPFVLGNPICCGCRLDAAYRPARVDLVEVWSRGSIDPLADANALRLWDRLRAAGHSVVAVCGRDWHGPAQERAVTGRRFPAVMVRAAPRPGDILEALARGAAYLSVGPFIHFALEHARGRTGPGEQVPGGVEAAEALIVLEGVEEECRLVVVESGGVILSRKVGPGRVSLRCPVRPSAAGVRVELRDAGGLPLLLTNPLGPP